MYANIADACGEIKMHKGHITLGLTFTACFHQVIREDEDGAEPSPQNGRGAAHGEMIREIAP